MPDPRRQTPLFERLDLAVTIADIEARCAAVKLALQEMVQRQELLEEALTVPGRESYGRRLMHRAPDGRYTVVVMSWGPGQGTPIHDHAGLWCVECVYRERVRVVSYDLVEELGEDRVRFKIADEVVARVGEAGALIPPFDFHIIENPFDVTAVTVHVYGGEMNRCDVFDAQAGGTHLRRSRELQYTTD